MRDLPERLEELASAYAQLASPPTPGELRRRHQRHRRVTAAAWLTLAAVLLVGALVAGGWVGTVGRPTPGPAAAPPSTKANTKATTPPSTTRPPRLTGTITRPQEGYQLKLPAGWYAVELSEPKQLTLGYGKPGKWAVEVYVRTALTLDPRLTRATDRKAAVLASSPWGPETETFATSPPPAKPAPMVGTSSGSTQTSLVAASPTWCIRSPGRITAHPTASARPSLGCASSSS